MALEIGIGFASLVTCASSSSFLVVVLVAVVVVVAPSSVPTLEAAALVPFSQKLRLQAT